jgi:hypothetical protein
MYMLFFSYPYLHFCCDADDQMGIPSSHVPGVTERVKVYISND